MDAPQPKALAPLMQLALSSFGKARSALAKGSVDEMIGQLTQGVEILDALDRVEARRGKPAHASAK